MDKRGWIPFRDDRAKNRFLYLLIFLLLLIAIQPVDEAIGKVGVLLDLITSFVFLSAIYSVSQKRHHAVIGVILAAPMLMFIWSRGTFQYTGIEVLGTLCGIAFFVFLTVDIVVFIFRQDKVTGDLIAGSAVVYLLMAVIWAYAYRIAEIIQPGSFYVTQNQGLDDSRTFLYYSFVTLTTLGYGDVVPAAILSRSLAILEAVIGQLYLVITVARLVGLHIAQFKGE